MCATCVDVDKDSFYARFSVSVFVCIDILLWFYTRKLGSLVQGWKLEMNLLSDSSLVTWAC